MTSAPRGIVFDDRCGNFRIIVMWLRNVDHIDRILARLEKLGAAHIFNFIQHTDMRYLSRTHTAYCIHLNTADGTAGIMKKRRSHSAPRSSGRTTE